MNEDIKIFFERSRQGKEDKPCFWSLHSSSSPGPPSEKSKPIELNMSEQDMEKSLDWLMEAIERHAPGQRSYMVVVLKTSPQDNGVYYTFKNPYYGQRQGHGNTIGIGGIGDMSGGNNNFIGMVQLQMSAQEKLHELRLEQLKQEFMTQRKIEELESQLENERSAKKTAIDKVLEHVAPHIEGIAQYAIQAYLNPSKNAIAGGPQEEQGEAVQDDEVDWRVVRDSTLELKKHFNNPESMLQDLAQVLDKNPHMAKMLMGMLQNAKGNGAQ